MHHEPLSQHDRQDQHDVFADRQGDGQPHRSSTNVGLAERLASVALGGGLTVVGLRQRGFGGAAMALLGGVIAYRGFSGHCALYHAAGVGGSDAGPTSHPLSREIHNRAAVTVCRPIADVYAFWRELSNVPQFMPRIRSLVFESGKDRHARWLGIGPGQRAMHFETRIIEDVPNERIVWRSVGKSDIHHRGEVVFRPAPGQHGTEVHLRWWYQPPLGVVGDLIGKLAGFNCRMQTRQGLRQMKQILEAGEVATSGPAHRTPATASFVESQTQGSAQDEARDVDVVEESSRESFPASDAPAYPTGRRR